MSTYWLVGESVDENNMEDCQERVNEDEGIDDIEEITFTFHVSEHDETPCQTF